MFLQIAISNLYHYAENNPVKYTDPDGRSIDVLRKGDSDKDIREDNIANRHGRDIQPNENPEEHNAIFDTRNGEERADLTGKVSEKTPQNFSEFLKSYFTRDTYEK